LTQVTDIPTVADLAFKYGTISRSDLDRINQIYAENQGEVSHSRIMIAEKIATEYQVGLLRLIQDYYIIRKKGEHFGKIAVEKGLATQSDIDKALAFQKREFKRAKLQKRIGDILVDSGIITEAQRDQIVAEQKAVENRAGNIMQSSEDQFESESGKTKDENRKEKQPNDNEYRLILKQDAAFIRKVKEKGLASSSELSAAEKKQRKEMEKKEAVSRVSDILVKWKVLTEDQKNNVLEELQSRTNETESSHENQLEIEVCETGMTARVNIDQKSGRSVELEEVKRVLAENKIVYGVFNDEVIQCFLDTGLPSFPVAGGDFPVEKTGRLIRYHFETEKDGRPVEKVKKGEALAELKLSEKHILGKDVRGNLVENVPEFGPQQLLRPAAGAVFSENREKVFAGKTGMPALTVEKKIYVHPGVHILEDADLRTGPLEKWADINVKGILSDSYPVQAGCVKTGEIRGTKLTATGNVTVEVGITGARIEAQGHIKARYLRNCIIETFGNVTIDNEIMDSTIRIGGKLEAGKARILTSNISAKDGIDAGAVGSDVTEACGLFAGRDDLVVEKSRKIDREKDREKQKLQALKDEWRENKLKADQLFVKMKELKKFHDRTDKKKKRIKEENDSSSGESEDGRKILSDLESKLASILRNLKTMNQEKKEAEFERDRILNQIETIEPSVQKKVADLEQDRFGLFKWARKNKGNPEIVIRVSVKQDTVFRGIYSSAVVQKDYGPLFVIEPGKSTAAGKTGGLEFRLTDENK